jgi:hypothetical protein
MLTLRPRSIADLFDETIRLYRRHWGAMVGIAAAAQVPWTILLTVLPSLLRPGRPPDEAGALVSFWLPLLHPLLVRPLMLAAVGVYLAELAQGGRIGPWRSYGRVLGRIVPMGAAMCLVAVATTIFGVMTFIGAALPFAFKLDYQSSSGSIFYGLWLFGVAGLVGGPAVFFYARWLVTPLAIAVERAGLRRGFRRSWDLTRRRLGYVIVVWFLLEALRLLLAAIPALVAETALTALLGSGSPVSWLAWLPSLVNLPFDVLILPIPLVGLALLYLDLRARFEGLDLALAARSPSPMEAPQPAGRLLRAADLHQAALVLLITLLVACAGLFGLLILSTIISGGPL